MQVRVLRRLLNGADDGAALLGALDHLTLTLTLTVTLTLTLALTLALTLTLVLAQPSTLIKH